VSKKKKRAIMKKFIFSLAILTSVSCSQNNFDGNPIIENFDIQSNSTTKRSSSSSSTMPISIFSSIINSDGLTRCTRSSATSCIDGLADVSVYVRTNGEILITGSNDLNSLQSIKIYKIKNGVLSVIREIIASNIGFCPGTLGAPEITLYNNAEVVLFQGVKNDGHCPAVGDLNGFNLKASIYYTSFEAYGLEDPSYKFSIDSANNFFGYVDPLVPKIDPSLFCEGRDCYFSYVYFDNGNKIAIKKFSMDSPRGENARSVEDLVNRELITEAPVIRKIANRYYLFYSTGNFIGNYGLNYRFADSIEHLIRPPRTSGTFGDGVILNPEVQANGQKVYNQGHGDVFEWNGEFYLGHHKIEFINDSPSGVRFSEFKKLAIKQNGFIATYSDNQFLKSIINIANAGTPINYNFGYINPAFQYSFDLHLKDENKTVIGPCVNNSQIDKFISLPNFQYSKSGKIYFRCISANQDIDSATVSKVVLVRLPIGATNWLGSESKEFDFISSGQQANISLDFF
jgi:hypothetical protein